MVPAGIERMPLVRFVVYTTLGTAFWNGVIVGRGWTLGAQWWRVQQYAHIFEYALLAIIVSGFLWFLWHRRKA